MQACEAVDVAVVAVMAVVIAVVVVVIVAVVVVVVVVAVTVLVVVVTAVVVVVGDFVVVVVMVVVVVIVVVVCVWWVLVCRASKALGVCQDPSEAGLSYGSESSSEPRHSHACWPCGGGMQVRIILTIRVWSWVVISCRSLSRTSLFCAPGRYFSA